MATMFSSPMLHSTHSHPHSPLNLSPAGSPSLRAVNPSKPSPAPSSGHGTPLGPFPLQLPPTASPSSATRSYARQPTQRPYQPLLQSRAASGSGRRVREIEGDSLKFAGLVAGIVDSRIADVRKGGLGLGLEMERKPSMDVLFHSGVGGSEARPALRETKSLAGSLAGSWEHERVELIVDVPVWSPGCFQDLSTLHALRDTTLSHTHSLLAHLMKQHGIPASYRLLARSAITRSAGGGRGGKPLHSGWGCIRLAPASHAVSGSNNSRVELKPKYRRSSMDIHDMRGGGSDSDVDKEREGRPHRRGITAPVALMSALSVAGLRGRGQSPAVPTGTKTPEMRLEAAIADDDEFAEGDEVELKTGYRSASISDDEDEEDADTLVAREVEKRGAREGSAFLMTLFGGPALILV